MKTKDQPYKTCYKLNIFTVNFIDLLQDNEESKVSTAEPASTSTPNNNQLVIILGFGFIYLFFIKYWLYLLKNIKNCAFYLKVLYYYCV